MSDRLRSLLAELVSNRPPGFSLLMEAAIACARERPGAAEALSRLDVDLRTACRELWGPDWDRPR